MRTDQAAGAVVTEEAYGAVGFAVVSEQASVAGAASVPGPITNEDSELWFVWQALWAQSYVATIAGFESAPGRVFDFDSKAMRKIEEGDAIVVVFENADDAHGMIIEIKYRMLIKLH